ncbi:alpha/beta hydrolase [Planococcus sp. FY231025]|uniref:alpha/beta hydrolase n=1 Tax=Planococcus sp. FY231025 TaxID=3455699 RepID=UPI003F92533E
MEKIRAGDFIYHIEEPNEKTGKTAILFHGWGGTVQSWQAYAEALAKQGHRVVVPEIVYNDSRKPAKNPFEMETVQTYFWKAIMESIEEFGEFQKVLEVPESDIVLIGSSMGGFIAAGIFARHPQISGLASINGSGAFVLTEGIFRERQDRSPMPKEAERVLRRFDPIEQEAGQGSVLLINGEFDRTVPLEGHEAYHRHLTEARGFRNIEKKIYQGAGHQFTREMERDVGEWLARVK